MEEDLYSSYSFLLDRTARKVKQYAQQQFNAIGLNITVDQWSIMKHLFEKGPKKQNEIAELTAKDNPTVTRIIDLLCKKGYAQRTAHPDDRRCFVVSLTNEGEAMVKDLKPQIAKIRLKAWEGLSKDDFIRFQNILETIYKNLD